ncbi:MAG: fumarate reductase subunit C [Duodenibacillus sp.]|nr:fumarate reductase subunit C [Duodenibacillus sp.]
MPTNDKIKYANVPSGCENIAGVALSDAKRASKWTAYTDVCQSVTGLIIGLFLFCHMFFTSSIQFGKGAFAALIWVSGGGPIFGEEKMWMHVLFIGFITLCVALHALCALRRFPTSYKQFRDIRGHITMVHHTDTSLWLIQITTAVALTGLVFPHVMGMLCAPDQIGPELSGLHTYHMGLLWTLFFLVCTELHGMIGLYRLAVKWDVVKDRGDKLRKIMTYVCAGMIVCGALTAFKFYSIGADVAEAQAQGAPLTSIVSH